MNEEKDDKTAAITACSQINGIAVTGVTVHVDIYIVASPWFVIKGVHDLNKNNFIKMGFQRPFLHFICECTKTMAEGKS